MTTPPSRLVLLSELRNVPVGTKVRFAGLVASYDPTPGILTLLTTTTSLHSQPPHHIDPALSPEAKEQRPQAHALVDTSHVLSTAPSRLFEPGAAVSVIGYCVATPSDESHADVRVQALMMWDAASASAASGAAGGDEYAEAVVARGRAMRGMEEARRKGGGE